MCSTGSCLRGSSPERPRALDRKDDLANFDLLPFFDLDLEHDAADRRRHFDHALSVSSSITGWPSAMLAPGLIIKRTRSPLAIFSPSSGSLIRCHSFFLTQTREPQLHIVILSEAKDLLLASLA